jgi:hypothetical protein
MMVNVSFQKTTSIENSIARFPRLILRLILAAWLLAGASSAGDDATKKGQPPGGAAPGASTKKGCIVDNDCPKKSFCDTSKKTCTDSLSAEQQLCGYDYHCEKGLRCLFGKCTKPIKCSKDADCGKDLKCFGGECFRADSPPQEEGKSCSYFGSGVCMPGLFCDHGECTKTPPTDGDCVETYECEGDLLCVAGKCRKELAAKGKKCLWANDCQEGLVCQAKKCKPIGNGDVGQVCAVMDDCWPGLICYENICTRRNEPAVKPACLTPKENMKNWKKGLSAGTACGCDHECNSNVCHKGKCAKSLSSIGGPCSKDAHCVIPSVCIAGLCRKSLSKKGKTCESDGDCKKDLVCKDGKCADKL